MDAAVWTLITLLAASIFGNRYYLGNEIDALGARLDATIETQGGRLEAGIDSLAARLDAHIDAQSG